jgi:hypothetical protein
MRKSDFSIKIQQDYNWYTKVIVLISEVTILPPLFDYWNKILVYNTRTLD